MNGKSADPNPATHLNLEFVRAEINIAFDRWHYWQQRLRDLLNSSERYSWEAFDTSARKIKDEMRHAHMEMYSKFYRYECLWQRRERISSSDGDGRESTEA